MTNKIEQWHEERRKFWDAYVIASIALTIDSMESITDASRERDVMRSEVNAGICSVYADALLAERDKRFPKPMNE